MPARSASPGLPRTPGCVRNARSSPPTAMLAGVSWERFWRIGHHFACRQHGATEERLSAGDLRTSPGSRA